MVKRDGPVQTRDGADGCEAAESCLECPLDRCMHDVLGGRRRYLRERRDALIGGLYRRGKGSREIAREMGVSQRTIQRTLRRQFEAEESK